MTDTPDRIEITPSGRALAAEVHGVDFSRPLPGPVADAVKAAWARHSVLLFRRQRLDDDRLAESADVFGGRQPAGSRAFFLKAGHKPGESVRVSTHPDIIEVSNLGQDGKPVAVHEGTGSSSLKWHSDNSYVEVPPAGSMLHAHVVPVDGGGLTSFSNQYLAYERLPARLRERVEGLHLRHDNTRNTAGRLRPTVAAPRSRDDITGPVHPIVRVHPVTRRRALYLGRHYEWPTTHVVELDDAASEALLAELWAHATDEALVWTHDWAAGDLLLWDNRCTMHARSAIDPSQPRVMHRVLIKGEPVISPWAEPSAA